jgi:hypothetical protein
VNAGTGTGPFRAAYASALLDYLLEPTETSLRVAYELAREAVGRSLSVLDLAVAHQEALTSVLADASDAAEGLAIVRAAGDFFLEGLSTFEMVQRGFAEAREAALLERRQTRLSRQLSTFLADASLALDASDSLEEMLRLVAEQARELVAADCCVVTVSVDGQPRSAEGASYPQDVSAGAPERRIGAGRRRAARAPAPVPRRERRSTASGMARRRADRPRRQRARRHTALRQAGRTLHGGRRGRPRPSRPDDVGSRGAHPPLPRATLASAPALLETCDVALTNRVSEVDAFKY